MSEPAPEPVVRGCVYFFPSTVTKQTKIGCSRWHPLTRLRQVRSCVPGIELADTFFVRTDDYRWLEKLFHEAFSHRRAQGEWFALTRADLALLKRMPDYISPSGELPLDLQLRLLAKRLKNGSSRLVAAFRLLTSLRGEVGLTKFLMRQLIADCDRRLPSLKSDSQLRLQSVLKMLNEDA